VGGARVAAAACLAVLLAAGAAVAAPAPAVRAELLSEVRSVRAGKPFTVAVRLEMDPGWHTYWANPGESGLATTVQWQLPPGFKAGPLQWPVPEKFETDGIVNYGYAGEVWLLADIRPPVALAPGEARIGAVVRWLGCEKLCVPGKAELALALAAPGDAAPDEALTGRFARARARLPGAPDAWALEASARGREIRLKAEPAGAPGPGDFFFFAAEPNVVDYAAPQRLDRKGSAVVLRLRRSGSWKGADRLRGVLIAPGGAVRVDVPIS
jgi:thiol:disulfide interchange protein DsbD